MRTVLTTAIDPAAKRARRGMRVEPTWLDAQQTALAPDPELQPATAPDEIWDAEGGQFTASEDVPGGWARQPDADPADVLALSDLRALISAAVGALPEPLRVAFVLRDVEELPMREVAEVLAIGESAAKMRVERARESLRVTLQGNV